MRVEDIIEALPDLNNQERASIIAACTLLQEKVAEVSSPEGMLWRGFQVFAEDSGFEIPPEAFMLKNKGWPGYKKKAALFDAWLMDQVGSMTEAEKAHAYRVAARCLMRLLDEWGVMRTTTALMGHTHNITHALNEQFPGYAAAGQLRRALL